VRYPAAHHRQGVKPHGTRYHGGGWCPQGKENNMLWTITVILLVLWLLGMVTSYTLGGMLHILLAIAIIMAIVSLFSGRRAGPPV
jgi:hypothetical protein